MHVWAPIRHMTKEGERKVYRPGDEVNEGDFSKEDVEYMKSEGILRDKPFPKEVREGESVRSYLLRAANEMAEEAQRPFREVYSEMGIDPNGVSVPQIRNREGYDAGASVEEKQAAASKKGAATPASDVPAAPTQQGSAAQS